MKILLYVPCTFSLQLVQWFHKSLKYLLFTIFMVTILMAIIQFEHKNKSICTQDGAYIKSYTKSLFYLLKSMPILKNKSYYVIPLNLLYNSIHVRYCNLMHIQNVKCISNICIDIDQTCLK